MTVRESRKSSEGDVLLLVEEEKVLLSFRNKGFYLPSGKAGFTSPQEESVLLPYRKIGFTFLQKGMVLLPLR